MRALASFLVALACLQAQARIIDRTLVTVNDDVILQSDVEKFIKKSKSKSFQELFGGIDEKVVNDRSKILHLLIEEKLIDQQVKKLELQATDQEVDGQIRTILKRNNITLPQLSERLKQLGTPMSEYRNGLKRQIERRALVDREIKPSLEVSEEQLRHFYQRSGKPADGGDTQYKIAHILIEDTKKGGTPAAVRAKKIAAEVLATPANFEKFAKEYSDDTSTAESGGLLGDFTPAQLGKEFRSIVPKTAVGQVAGPIKTKAGFHFVKVLEAHAADFSTLSREQKEALRNQMLSSELERKMGMWLERKKTEAHIRFAADATGGEPATASP